MILGNLYREKGQVGRAINVHQALLQRPDLTTLEHAYVLLCLGLDFRHGGFVDRALEAFQEVLQLDPHNRYALVNLQKLHEDQHQWAEALQVREQIAKIDAGRRPDDLQILGFLRNQIGSAQSRDGQRRRRRAHLHRCDRRRCANGARLSESRRRPRAAGQPGRGRRGVGTAGRHASPSTPTSRSSASSAPTGRSARRSASSICASGSSTAVRRTGAPASRSHATCPAPATIAPPSICCSTRSPTTRTACPFTRRSGRRCRASASIPTLVRRYVTLTREAVFYLDPHVCRRCRYRSTELLWQCPQCHEWNTFVEERIAPGARTADGRRLGVGGKCRWLKSGCRSRSHAAEARCETVEIRCSWPRRSTQGRTANLSLPLRLPVLRQRLPPASPAYRLREAAFGADDVVGAPDFFVDRQLRREPLAGFPFARSETLHHAPELDVRIAGGHDDRVEVLVAIHFVQERNVGDRRRDAGRDRARQTSRRSRAARQDGRSLRDLGGRPDRQTRSPPASGDPPHPTVATIDWPNRRTTAANPGVLGAMTSCASVSLSMVGTPSFSNCCRA